MLVAWAMAGSPINPGDNAVIIASVTSKTHKRHVSGIGWVVEVSGGRPVAIEADDGSVARVVSAVVGTKEAAAMIGVRPPNFVRDWSTRPDFPRPVSTLSSGRVWSRDEVAAYAGRATAKPSRDRMLVIARRAVWWQDPERTLARPLDFVAHVLAQGTLDEIADVERFYGLATLRTAVLDAPAGVFDRRAWNFWLLALDLDRSTPAPARRVP